MSCYPSRGGLTLLHFYVGMDRRDGITDAVGKRRWMPTGDDLMSASVASGGHDGVDGPVFVALEGSEDCFSSLGKLGCRCHGCLWSMVDGRYVSS